MEVKEISYRELINIGNFENIAIEITASVDKTDNIEMCLTKIRNKVKRELKNHRREE